MIRIIAVFLLSFLFASTVLAQEMPPPRRMPRTPVSSEALEEREGVTASREVVGQAVVIDGERLRIGKAEMRLFGIVPPQLSASFGPQARAHIDALAGGQNVTCRIRDRDRDGRLLANCVTANGTDMAHDLLKRGLAVAARGSLVGTELASAYASAEQLAQNQKIGLWSLTTAASAQTPHAKPEVKQEAAPTPPAPAPAEIDSKKDDKAQPSRNETQMQAKVTADILAQKPDAYADEEEVVRYSEAGFLEKYQLLISGFLMLGTAVFVVNALNIQRLREKREEIRSLAAALRGELMAARSICSGRARSITTPADDRTAVWPRIRTTLYQAYVGRLGLMGADLARRIASIYGQSGDYAALYNPVCPPMPGHEVSKKQALETLIKHIDEVLPRLAEIEKIGKVHPLTFAQRTLAPIEHRAPVEHRLRIEHHKPVESLAPTEHPLEAENEAPAPDDPHMIVQPEAPLAQHMAHRVAQQRSAIEVMSGFWEHTRSFVTNLRSQDVSPRPSVDASIDPNAAEYTAIIEADMERYQRETSDEVAVGRHRQVPI